MVPRESSPTVTPSSGEIKMIYREKRKGNSLAWNSANGVNEDELMYDSKQRLPPSSCKRAGLLAGRLNLLSISSHTATFRNHFGGANNGSILAGPICDPEPLFFNRVSFLGTKLRTNIASAAILLAASDAASVTSLSLLAAESTIVLDESSCYDVSTTTRRIKIDV